MKNLIKSAMFVVVGMVLASGGIGVTDWQIYATLIAVAIAANVEEWR